VPHSYNCTKIINKDDRKGSYQSTGKYGFRNMNKKMIEIISRLRIWNGHTKTFIAKQIHLSKLHKQHQNGTSFLLKFEKAWCDKRYIYEIQQGNMRWIRVKSTQKIHMHTSTCGRAALPFRCWRMPA
jgi:hypothetical protein